jgi:hypothetical protein
MSVDILIGYLENGLHTARIFLAFFASRMAVEMLTPPCHYVPVSWQKRLNSNDYTRTSSSLLPGDFRDLLIAFGLFDNVWKQGNQ